MGGGSHPGIGTILGDTYRLERVLGKGGMGTVYEASHTRLPRRFAVKLLLPEIVAKRELFERFRREAEIASSAGHENIVEAFDFNLTEEGVPYIVMELLEGESLRGRLDRVCRLSVEETVSIVGQVAGALAAAHDRGIVHRDLKPENVFLCRRHDRTDFVKVLDFGVSKLVHSETISTQSGSLIGTPQYMAPEQASDTVGNVDHRVDVFALGAITYECLTGQFAFGGSNPVGILYNVVHGSPEALAKLRPDVPVALQAVVERALSKRAEDRFGDCVELRRELRSAVGLATLDTLRSSVSSSAPTLAAGPRPEIAVKSHADTRAETLGQAAVTATTRSLGPTKRGWWWGAGALAVAGVGLALAFFSSGGSEPGEPAASASAEPVVPAPRVRLELQVTPPTARVEIDGVTVRGDQIALDRSDDAHEVVVSAPGYVTETRSFRAVTDGTLEVKLMSAPAAAPEEPEPKPHPAPAPARPAPAPARPAPAPARPAPAPARPKPAPAPAKSPAPIGPVERSL